MEKNIDFKKQNDAVDNKKKQQTVGRLILTLKQKIRSSTANIEEFVMQLAHS